MTRRHYLTRATRDDDRETNFHETLSPTMGYREAVTNDRDGVRPLGALEMIIGWIATIVSALLAIRFVLALLGVDASTSAANFIYATTNGFTKPFSSLFGYYPTVGTSYFDLPAIAAIIVIAVISSLLVGILRSSRR